MIYLMERLIDKHKIKQKKIEMFQEQKRILKRQQEEDRLLEYYTILENRNVGLIWNGRVKKKINKGVLFEFDSEEDRPVGNYVCRFDICDAISQRLYKKSVDGKGGYIEKVHLYTTVRAKQEPARTYLEDKRYKSGNDKRKIDRCYDGKNYRCVIRIAEHLDTPVVSKNVLNDPIDTKVMSITLTEAGYEYVERLKGQRARKKQIELDRLNVYKEKWDKRKMLGVIVGIIAGVIIIVEWAIKVGKWFTLWILSLFV